jgi:DNA-binding ferritin-like protein (Dps family)
MDIALTQVLGAVAYGEWKAYVGAKEEAAAAEDPEQRRRHRVVAAEELRHHKGFVGRLEAMGADPERAMRPFRTSLDRYHGRHHDDPVVEAVYGYLGEGVASDLLQWLRKVVDAETAAFIDTVIADERGHEADAAAELREVLETVPGARPRAARAARQMLRHMAWSGGNPGALSLVAFLRVGRTDELLRSLLTGHVRRMRAVGLAPFGLPVPAALVR